MNESVMMDAPSKSCKPIYTREEVKEVELKAIEKWLQNPDNKKLKQIIKKKVDLVFKNFLQYPTWETQNEAENLMNLFRRLLEVVIDRERQEFISKREEKQIKG